MKDIKILLGAQSWAYGPAGKACAIAHVLKNLGAKTVFVGSNTSYQMCRDSGHFDKLFEVADKKKFDFLPNYDAVVSVMDPYLALLASKKDAPVIYADSMSWFWKWDNLNNIGKIVNRLKAVSFKEGCELLDSLEPDIRQLCAHAIADKIFTQGPPQLTIYSKGKIKNVGAMIDLGYRKRNLRDTLIVSLSGGISPATDLRAILRYSDLVFDLMKDYIKYWPKAKRFLFTGNPKVISSIEKNKWPDFIEFRSLTHKDFLLELNRALAVLIPCGFTTIYKSLAYGAPLAFLPENHNGHVYEYLTITKSIKKKPEQIFPHCLFTLTGSSLENIRPIEESMTLIKSYTDKYFLSESFREKQRSIVRGWIKLFRRPDLIYKKQKEAIKFLIPNFRGARVVAREAILMGKHVFK